MRHAFANTYPRGCMCPHARAYTRSAQLRKLASCGFYVRHRGRGARRAARRLRGHEGRRRWHASHPDVHRLLFPETLVALACGTPCRSECGPAELIFLTRRHPESKPGVPLGRGSRTNLARRLPVGCARHPGTARMGPRSARIGLDSTPSGARRPAPVVVVCQPSVVLVAEKIDWFNHRRLRGKIGLVPPDEFENNHDQHRRSPQRRVQRTCRSRSWRRVTWLSAWPPSSARSPWTRPAPRRCGIPAPWTRCCLPCTGGGRSPAGESSSVARRSAR